MKACDVIHWQVCIARASITTVLLSLNVTIIQLRSFQTRNWSRIATHLVLLLLDVLVLVVATVFKNPKAPIFFQMGSWWNLLGMFPKNIGIDWPCRSFIMTSHFQDSAWCLASFHAEMCCHLVSEYKQAAHLLCSSVPPVPDLQYIRTCFPYP